MHQSMSAPFQKDKEMVFTLNTVKKKYKTLGEFAYEQIKARIMNGQLEQGTVISELNLSEQLAISRTPVKNALYRLAMDGLVEIIPNKGYVVRQFSIKEIIEITQAREALEGMAARLACDRLKSADLDYVRSLFPDRSEKKAEEITEQMRINGEELHAFLIKKSGNFVIADLLSRFSEQISQSSTMASLLPDRKLEAYYEHIEIVDALIDRNAKEAELCMRKHLANHRLAILKGMLF